MSETPDERNKRFRELRESIADELLAKNPEATFSRGQYGIDLIHYIPSYSDGIRIAKRARSINNSVFSLDPYYLTEQTARKAIERYVFDAKQKFIECCNELSRVKSQFDFTLWHSIEGDTHGIEDHACLSFKLGGFDFTFTLPDD